MLSGLTDTGDSRRWQGGRGGVLKLPCWVQVQHMSDESTKSPDTITVIQLHIRNLYWYPPKYIKI